MLKLTVVNQTSSDSGPLTVSYKNSMGSSMTYDISNISAGQKFTPDQPVPDIANVMGITWNNWQFMRGILRSGTSGSNPNFQTTWGQDTTDSVIVLMEGLVTG